MKPKFYFFISGMDCLMALMAAFRAEIAYSLAMAFIGFCMYKMGEEKEDTNLQGE